MFPIEWNDLCNPTDASPKPTFALIFGKNPNSWNVREALAGAVTRINPCSSFARHSCDSVHTRLSVGPGSQFIYRLQSTTYITCGDNRCFEFRS
jgi:hypothetical protein